MFLLKAKRKCMGFMVSWRPLSIHENEMFFKLSWYTKKACFRKPKINRYSNSTTLSVTSLEFNHNYLCSSHILYLQKLPWGNITYT